MAVSPFHARVLVPLAVAMVLAGCSGSTEDVRITFCKNLSANMQPAGAEVVWEEPEVVIHRPSHAITTVRASVTDSSGQVGQTEVACWFAYEKWEHPPTAVANPLEEYDTLPYALTVDGRELSDDEVRQAVRGEQKRQGKAILGTLQQGAKDVAEQVRAGIGG